MEIRCSNPRPSLQHANIMMVSHLFVQLLLSEQLSQKSGEYNYAVKMVLYLLENNSSFDMQCMCERYSITCDLINLLVKHLNFPNFCPAVSLANSYTFRIS